jgi:vancomycin resistance protein YoaR
MVSNAPSKPRLLLPALIATASVVLVLGAYGISRAISAGKVLGSVQAEGVELGGLDPDNAAKALTGLEDQLRTTPAPFLVKDVNVSLLPDMVAFRLDHSSMLADAFAIGRHGSVPAQFWWWVNHLFEPVELEVDGDVDPEALEQVFIAWDEEAIGSPPFEGGVQIDGGNASAQYPRAGEMIDRGMAPAMVIDQLRQVERDEVPLPVVLAEPRLTNADIDRAVDRARLILAGPVTLSDPATGREVSFSIDELAEALDVTLDEEVNFAFDPEAVDRRLAMVRAELEDEPVDAQLSIDGNQVSVIPGKNGTLVDSAETAESLMQAATTAVRRGTLPVREGAEPAVTTASLEQLDIRHLVSEFTTYHVCCQNRVTNIHLIADKVDGAIVRPGENFSLNEYVGQRTTEDGYLEDGTIIGGRLEPTVGGGVSQFATTFYNALFWGGYEDVTHKTHSFYISRYPAGIEATISWPAPDLVFRNNRSSAVLIKTEYTSTSITVKFYGNNDGRMFSGEQREGTTRTRHLAEGGSQARVIHVSVSDRFDFREPPPPKYEADPALEVDQQKVEQSPLQGFSVRVVREITGGGVAERNEWTVRYVPRQEIIKVHPCRMPDAAPETCPTTTTLPPPPEETTTIPPPTP